MKKLLSISLLSSTILCANYLGLNPGWNLVGTDTKIDVKAMYSKYENNISIIWYYNNGAWKAYSNDTTIQSRINNNYTKLDVIDTHKGYWVYNNTNRVINVIDGNGITVTPSINNLKVVYASLAIDNKSTSVIKHSTVELKLPNGTKIGSINYHPDYDGKKFYLSANGKLYEGKFTTSSMILEEVR